MASLASVFRGNEILLTGANGFVGKVILALFLDRFPGVGRVHVLIRPRADLPSDERFAREVLDSPPLQPLVKKMGREAVQRRVNVLSGDASNPNAGLGPDAARRLGGRIRLVLNCAGLVEFFPPVDLSLRANVESVERLVEFCDALDAKLLHVSTCYVAGEADSLIEETESIRGFFPRRSGPSDRSFDPERELAEIRAAASAAAAGLSGTQRSEALKELGRVRAARWGWVNTYTYSKSLGEQIIVGQSAVPHSIVRPAIVESALRYPFPGWIEGGRTAAPLALMALGGLLDWPVRRDLSLEIVPVDLVAAATLTVAGELLAGRAKQVYHLASSDVNPYPLEDLIRLLCAAARSNGGRPSYTPIWLDPIRRLRFLDSAGAERRRRVQRYRIAAARRFMDRLGLREQGARLRLLELQLGFHEETFRQYTPFILENRHVFEAVNIRSTYCGLTREDRQALPWDPESIDWPHYWKTCQIPGIRKWVQPEAVREWSFQL